MKSGASILTLVVLGWQAAADGQTVLRCEPVALSDEALHRRPGCDTRSPASAVRLVQTQYGATSTAQAAPPASFAPLGSAPITTTATQLESSCCTPCAPAPQGCCPPAVSVPNGCARFVAFRPVVAFSPMPGAYYVGRGILGQPTVYVPGQPVRNILRWLTP